jgi:hypothetical protein
LDDERALDSETYFALIERTTRWVVFDTAQYIRRGWVNRNRILHPTRGWQYVTVPLAKMPRETPIREVRISPGFAERPSDGRRVPPDRFGYCGLDRCGLQRRVQPRSRWMATTAEPGSREARRRI